MPIPKPTSAETEEAFVSRCIGEIYDEYGQEQSAAICYNTYRKAEGMSGDRLVASKINQFNKYKGINLATDGLEDACWDGYEAIGTKILDGREVPNCVPITEMERIPIEIVGDNEEKVLEYLPEVKPKEMEDVYLKRCIVVLYPEYYSQQMATALCADKYQRKITVED
jgi:hypothetical protein